MSNLRQDAVEIWNAGVDAVRAEPLVQREVNVAESMLQIAGHQWDRANFDRVIVVGAGKAGTAMAAGLIASIGDWLPVIGWVNVPEGTEQDLGTVTIHPARPAGVNEPTAAGVAGTSEILNLVQHAGPRDLCIALISGGGSALLPAPIEGITLEDKQQVTRFLSSAGADITELNTVRKHLSQIKGGGLLAACKTGALVTLVLSDVLGDPLDLIASGPTVPDPSTPLDAISILQRYDPQTTLSDRIYQTLQSLPRRSGSDAQSVCPNQTIVLGNNAIAVDEAGIVAERRGYNHVMQSAQECEGPAEEIGQRIAELTLRMLRTDPNSHRNDCLITGGEPTVKLAPAEVRGRGGRNQQLVLAAYQTLLKLPLSNEDWDRICILSGGTDGEDGPTDAAGAILDNAVHIEASKQSLDVDDFLSRNDAYSFFEKVGGLLKTGPTGTNVCDVRVALVSLDDSRPNATES
ncbi:MAG: glycerate kinase type-2 family protein [Rubripirellula sp.]